VKEEEKRAEYLYIHIPFCRRKCDYCGFYSVPIAGEDVGRVLGAMLKELEGDAAREQGSSRTVEQVKTIYVGGGSPSCLGTEKLTEFLRAVTQRVGISQEFTVEVNPGQVDYEMLRRLREVGVNRLSIGAQSLTNSELNYLGRGYKADKVYEAYEQGRRAGFENISLDVIFGLPGTQVEDWQKNVQKIVKLKPEHVSAYSLSYEEGTKLYRQKEEGEVQEVEEEIQRQMYEATIDILEGAQIKQYEISNFARQGFECQHNLAYWSGKEYLGIGPGASSYWGGRRWSNVKDTAQYLAAVEQGTRPAAESVELSAEEIACETALLMLRRTRGIERQEYYQLTGFEVERLFAEPIGRYQKMGLLEVDERGVRLRREARAIADTILCDFAAL